MSSTVKNSGNKNEQDVHEVFKENFEKYFREVEKIMPQYLESVTKLQEEFLEAWKNTINKSLDFQKEYSEKANINTQIPQDAANIIYNIAEEYIKSKNFQNQVILSTMNSANATLKDSQNAFEPFMELNKKVLDFWSDFYIKNKQ